MTYELLIMTGILSIDEQQQHEPSRMMRSCYVVINGCYHMFWIDHILFLICGFINPSLPHLISSLYPNPSLLVTLVSMVVWAYFYHSFYSTSVLVIGTVFVFPWLCSARETLQKLGYATSPFSQSCKRERI